MPSGRGQDQASPKASDPEAAEAVLGIALAALWADGRERLAEAEVLRHEFERLSIFDQPGVDNLPVLATSVREAYAAQGVEAYLTEQADLLEPPWTLAALTLATDIVMADREVTEEELALLDTIGDLLGVPDSTVDSIRTVLTRKHNLDLTPDKAPTASYPGPEPEVDPAEAALAFAVGAMQAATEDEGNVGQRLAPLRARGNVPEEGFVDLVHAVEQQMSGRSKRTYLEACAQALDEEEREQAFTWAADVALADRRIERPEHDYLTDIREILGIEPSVASNIVDVLWTKHYR